MKILLINALNINQEKTSFFNSIVRNLFVNPSLSTQQIAAITPKNHSVRVIDDAYNNIKFTEKNYDLIAISCIHTSSALRAYEIADKFRQQKKTVVLGGWHPSILPNEAKQHANSIVIGEAEHIWPQLLKDHKKGELKPFYYQKKPVYFKDIPHPDREILNKNSLTAGVQASRGCPFGCEFCTLTNQQFGCIFRTRTIENVIEEIRVIPQKIILFYDSSFTLNPDYTKTLFKELKVLKKKFRCWMNADLPLKDEEFLKLASEAGCIAIDIGFESLSNKTINILGKKTIDTKTSKKVIRKIHDHGISVGGTFMFGFDNDTKKTMDETLQNISSIDIDVPRFAILTPFPGTPLYHKLDADGRIFTKDWSKYDLNHVVFHPKNMSPEELQSEWQRIYNEVYSSTNLLKRTCKKNNLNFSSWIWRLTFNIFEKGVNSGFY